MPSTVLIVDDDPGVLNSYERMLKLEGYTVVTAANAEQGLARVDQFQPDAIILDLRMPVVDGLEFLRRLRQRDVEQRVGVAVVTGDYLIDESTAADLEALGATIRLKPLWLDDLVGLAGQLVQR